MKRSSSGALKTGVLAAGTLLIFSAYGAQHTGPKANMPPGAGAQQMSEMMHDMRGQMEEMSKAMSQGNMTSAQQKRIADRMHAMSEMMGNLSGMMGGGMMLGDEHQRQMQGMRKQMDQMMKEGGGAMPRK